MVCPSNYSPFLCSLHTQPFSKCVLYWLSPKLHLPCTLQPPPIWLLPISMKLPLSRRLITSMQVNPPVTSLSSSYGPLSSPGVIGPTCPCTSLSWHQWPYNLLISLLPHRPLLSKLLPDWSSAQLINVGTLRVYYLVPFFPFLLFLLFSLLSNPPLSTTLLYLFS